ncbi:MAG: hypothetical protein J3R72DRAFT_493789 [Linnemannia gamsii]|nr:MAG: hypothetical protein J3R72DRAFT_493789 [Linnemannia gamsii]
MTNNRPSLFCLVDGLPSSGAFPIKTSFTYTIGDLKDLIKTKQLPAFDDITGDPIPTTILALPSRFMPLTTRLTIDLSLLEALLSLIISRINSPKTPSGSPKLAREAQKIEKGTFHADTPTSRFLRSFVEGNLSIFDADAYPDQTPVIPLASLERLLRDQFRQVQGQMSLITLESLTNKFLVLDEAQTLSDHGRGYFVSHTDPNDLRSLLSSIVHGLRNISKDVQDYRVVTCGTGFGADEPEILVSSGGIALTSNQIDHRIMDFSGWETENQVGVYINNLGDAMSDDDRAMLHTLIPRVAVQELFFKLRGRFRPIIMTIEDIIANGSPSYWREAIERIVRALVCYPEQFPMRGNLCSDIKRMLDKVAKDPNKYANAIEPKHILKKTVLHRASLGLPWSLEGEGPILVESAFGRLRIAADKAAAGKTTSTIIDEPFNEDKRFYKHFREQYRDLQDPQSEGKIFERHAPLDLIFAFHKKQLKQGLFSIPKAAIRHSTTIFKTPIPQLEPVTFPRHLFEHKATIVRWEGYEWGARYKETLTMSDFLEAHYRHGSRRGDSTAPPFYYPESSLSGPDIVFVLRINDQLYSVFVQNKLLNKIHPRSIEKARLTVHEARLKAYLPNLAMYCPGGKYLSLIYSHTAITKKPREGWNSVDLWDSDSEIGTDHDQVFKDGNMPLMQLLMIIDGSNMRNFVPGGLVDLLDSVKGVKSILHVKRQANDAVANDQIKNRAKVLVSSAGYRTMTCLEASGQGNGQIKDKGFKTTAIRVQGLDIRIDKTWECIDDGRIKGTKTIRRQGLRCYKDNRNQVPFALVFFEI